MRTPLTLTVLVLLPTLFTGCVLFPHGELMAPPAEGKIVDSETLSPLPHARVVRQIERLNRDRTTCTDAQGDFSFPKDTDLKWLLMVDYAANKILYRVEAGGYRTFETNLYGGGSFSHGSLPHDLGVVRLQKETDKIKTTDAAD